MGNTSGNREVKEKLMEKYGKQCMFEKAKIEERLSEVKTIRSFKSFKSEKRFKKQFISYNLTLHHLKHRSEGGKTNEENGAVVSEIAHQYLHSLPRAQEEIINNMLRQFKINCVIMENGEVQVDSACSFSFDIGDDFIEIPVYENKKEVNKKLKMERIKNKNRAQRKREEREIIEESLEEEER